MMECHPRVESLLPEISYQPKIETLFYLRKLKSVNTSVRKLNTTYVAWFYTVVRIVCLPEHSSSWGKNILRFSITFTDFRIQLVRFLKLSENNLLVSCVYIVLLESLGENNLKLNGPLLCTKLLKHWLGLVE